MGFGSELSDRRWGVSESRFKWLDGGGSGGGGEKTVAVGRHGRGGSEAAGSKRRLLTSVDKRFEDREFYLAIIDLPVREPS
ncbi:hypothetical protein SDJN03_12343, partial [Cucurbita argyrosperma subsp. sororia]